MHLASSMWTIFLTNYYSGVIKIEFIKDQYKDYVLYQFNFFYFYLIFLKRLTEQVKTFGILCSSKVGENRQTFLISIDFDF